MGLSIYASNTINIETLTVESKKSVSKINCIDASLLMMKNLNVHYKSAGCRSMVQR